ncbi:MAG TPA: S8 family peptidase [bacterium]|nr:S8 family peptidase [bacterium]HNS33689.1 S8 family peptidase [bacterium]HQA63613.1 S8 family peptidase [bacterium]
MFKISNQRIIIGLLLSILTLPFFSITGLAYTPSDPMYSFQPYLEQIEIESAWEEAKGRDVVVAVLDSGIDINHPDLAFNIWTNSDEKPGDGIDNDNNGYVDDVNGWDFVLNLPDPRPKLEEGYSSTSINHGTAIAGLIGAVGNNGKGIIGSAFYAKIMPIRILGGDGTGDVGNLIKAIRYAVNNGANIINLSLVGYEYSEELKDIIAWANNKGVLVVSAAGNSNENGGVNLDSQPAYPACYGDNQDNNLVVAVSAVNNNDQKSSFTNYGSCIDVSSPGEALVSLAYYSPAEGFNDYYSYGWQGTSFSAALVSGVAALIKSKDPSLTPEKISEILLFSVDDIDEQNSAYVGKLGTGRINASLALGSDLISGAGYLGKLATAPAVYFIDGRGERHLFSNEATYWSWHQGAWTDQDIKVISQAEFDSLAVGRNITVRPGTNLVRFENSPRVYAVGVNQVIYHLTEERARQLFGDNFGKRAVIIQNAFETDYRRASQWTDSPYPSGSLISYINSDKVYYLEGQIKRLVTPESFVANNFNRNYVISDVSVDFIYQTGLDLGTLSAYEI